MAGQTFVAAEAQQITPDELAFLGVWHKVPWILRLFVPCLQRRVVHRQHRIDNWDRVPRDQDEAVTEAVFWMANIPAHEAAKRKRHQQVHFRTRTAGMAALSVIFKDVDVLIDTVLDLLPVSKMLFQVAIACANLRLGGDVHIRAITPWQSTMVVL